MAVKELKTLLKHSSVYSIGNIFGQAAGFLLLPFYTNYLTPKDYGVAALVETTVSVAGIMAAMGIGYSIARFYSKGETEPEKNCVISTSYYLIWLLAIVCIPLLFLLSGTLSDIIFSSTEYKKYFMLSIAAFFIGLNVDVGQTYFIQKQKSLTFVTSSVANTLTLISFNIYFIAVKKTGLIGVFYSSLISKIIFAVVLTIIVMAQVKFRFSITLAIAMVKYSFPLGISTVFRVITQESDKLFVNYYFSPVQTGIYVVASKIANAVHVLITTTFNRSYQSIRFEICKKPDGKRIYGIILEQYIVVIGSAGLIISIFSYEIIMLMTKESFYSAAYYIPPLICSWIIFGAKYHLENGMLISMNTRHISHITLVSSTFNVGFNYVFIPKYGIWGAVLASNISNIIYAGSSYYISQKYYDIEVDWSMLTKYISILLTCYVFGTLVVGQSIPTTILIKLSIILTYCMIIYKFNMIDIKSLMSHKKAVNTEG